MFSFLVFLFIVGILISIHEFGHFIMAKKMGVKVEKFSLGFGPVIFTKKIKDTEYIISLIPFGGYVKLAGDNLLEYKGRPDEYLSKSLGQRSLIVLMGPVLNYLMAIFCFWAIFYLGYPMLTTKIGEVLADYGAKQAGLLEGDIVVKIDGNSVKYWEDLQKEIHPKKENDTVTLEVLRQNKTYTFEVKIKEKEILDVFGRNKKMGVIGVRPSGDLVFVKHSLFSSLVGGFKKVMDLTFAIYGTIFRIILGKVSLKETVTGPLGLFYFTKEAVKLGFIVILHLVAVLNVSLAVFNLLPIPVLDGGHLLLLGIEKIRGKYLSHKTEEIINRIGLSFIITIALIIFYNDLSHFGIWSKISKFLK